MRLPREAQIWLPGYLASRLRSVGRPAPARVWVAIADHYEPLYQAGEELGRQRVRRWTEQWPAIAARHADSLGRRPKYTFFYPEDEYRPFLLDPLARLSSEGAADVEVHIHHDDGPHGAAGRQRFIDRMEGYLHTLTVRHGLLRKHGGKTAFGFIHGNWALDNSRPDGRWCGVNDEIRILSRMGCYADFTMPSGASPTQSAMVNTIYWATDDPEKPKSYDRGVPARPGGGKDGDLLMIPGPFGLRWAERFYPRMEGGEIAGYDPPTRYRVRRWVDLAPRMGADCMIKLFTHGAQERNSEMLLGGGLDTLFEAFRQESARQGWALHYVSAWEMFQAVESLRLGLDPVAAIAGKARENSNQPG